MNVILNLFRRKPKGDQGKPEPILRPDAIPAPGESVGDEQLWSRIRQFLVDSSPPHRPCDQVTVATTQSQQQVVPPPGLPAHTGIPSEHQKLWQRISRFELDEPDAELPFSERLADMFLWKHEFALRVVEEYKRFMFICVVSGHMVSPSVSVDEVWHLHLQYTSSYSAFCSQALGRFIHHSPSRGGDAEERKYEEIYGKTLNQYYKYFGMPPRDIWGPQNQRNVYAQCAARKGKKVKIVRD